MTDTLLMQYVGFEVKHLVRTYTFSVRHAGNEVREFTITIMNEAFDSHRVRYQDAPDICSLKLRRELAACDNHPLKTSFRISETELDDYRASHMPKGARNLYAPKAAREF